MKGRRILFRFLSGMMRKPVLMLLIMLFCTIELPAQNLLTNPGFEAGTAGWGGLWTRTPGAGQAEIVNTPVHSGNSALHILHWGAEDWSFAPAEKFPAKPGQIFEFSAWVNVRTSIRWSELSVALFDSAYNAIDWSHAASKFAPTNGTFSKYTTRFIVPENVKYLWPRFIGRDSCDLVIDDVTFVLADSIENTPNYVLENQDLRVEIRTSSFVFDILDKRNSRTYRTLPGYLFKLESVDSSAYSISLHCRYIPDDFDITIRVSLQGATVKVQLLADSSQALSEAIAFPGAILSRVEDYFIIPRAAGLILPVQMPYPFGKFRMWGHKATMAFAGVTNLQNGYLITSDDPWDTQIDFPQTDGSGTYSLQLLHVPSKGKFGYSRTFYYTIIDEGGYVEMCRWYRRHVEELGYVKTFQEKMQENPNVAKLQGAVDFWTLLPSFKRPAFIDSLVDFGIDRAIISLSGSWYTPEPLAEVIDTINARGLLSSRYDIYTDVWPPTYPHLPWYRTEGYPEDVIVDADGSLHEGWLAYLGDGTPFQGYYTCSQTHTRYAQKWISQDLAINRYNCRFIDVELASALLECYSTIHPVTRQEDANYRVRLMDTVKNGFGLVTGGEEGRDFAFPSVDYGEGTMSIVHANNAGYSWATPVDDPGENYVLYNVNPAARIPLHGLVYHDVHVATWYTGDGVSKVPAYWDDKDLFNVLYASMPLFLPPDAAYWQAHRERFLTSYHLVGSVFRRAGFAQMTDHRMLTPDWKVQQTTFANGWTVVANFGASDYDFRGRIIPAKGFYAGDGTEEVYKLINGNAMVAVARLSDRLFVHPFDREISLAGVRTSGAVFLRKHRDFIHLAFIGDQDYVDIQPDSLPWPLANVRVFTRDRSAEVQPQILPQGWLRIHRLGKALFYRIEGDFITAVPMKPTEPLSRKPELSIYPNPFNSQTTLRYLVFQSGVVKIRLFNVLGELVQTLLNRYHTAGNYKVTFSNDKLASGLYVFQLEAAGERIRKKVVIIK